MGAGLRAETKTLDRIVAIAAMTAGIGFAVTNKVLAANVATLTIGAHDLQIGDKVLVRGVDGTFDGVELSLTAVTPTTISYALVAGNVGSTAVTIPAGVSKRASIGYKRWSDADNFEAEIRALSSLSQGYFWAAIDEDKSRGLNEMKSLSFVGELVIYCPRELSNDLNTAWEFALGIRDAIERAENFQIGEFRAQVGVKLRDLGKTNNGQVAIFDFHGIDVPHA